MISQEQLTQVVKRNILENLTQRQVLAQVAQGTPELIARRNVGRSLEPYAERITNLFFETKRSMLNSQEFTPEVVYRLIERATTANPKEIETLAKVNLKMAKKWPGQISQHGHFTISSCFVPYTESPFGFEIKYNGVRVGTIGGFIDKRDKHFTAVINNLQGVSPKVLFEEAQRNPLLRHQVTNPESAAMILKLLDKEFAPHFRLTLTRMVVSATKKQLRIRIEGDPPVRKGTKTEAEYAERLKRYRQTFIEAGLREVQNNPRGNWFLPVRRAKPKKPFKQK